MNIVQHLTEIVAALDAFANNVQSKLNELPPALAGGDKEAEIDRL